MSAFKRRSTDQQHHMSRPVLILSVTQVLTAAGLVASIIMHSTDSDSALVQRVASNEARIVAVAAESDQRAQDRRQFEATMQKQLDALDGKVTDIYHLLLARQEAEGAK